MIKVTIKDNIKNCDCCGKTNLKRALKVGNIQLGVTCAGNRFDLNLSGNPYDAAKRLQHYINNTLSKENYQEIIDEIKSDSLVL